MHRSTITVVHLVSFLTVSIICVRQKQTNEPHTSNFNILYSLNALLKPLSLSCGHSGCLYCLKELTRNTSVPKCHMCQREFQAASISVNVALDHVTSELEVKCLSSGCDWKRKYGKVRVHFNKCPRLQIQCKNKGCRYEVVRENMPLHEQSCSKREVPCSDWNRSVTRDLLQRHQNTECTNTLRECP